MIQIIPGDCREGMAGLGPQSVHLCVTSPPYWGLRDYKLEPVVWGEGDGCAHVWGEATTPERKAGIPSKENHKQGYRTSFRTGAMYLNNRASSGPASGAFCQHCPAWRGTLGLEPTLDCTGFATGAWCGQCYVCHMAEVFDAVWRVLRNDGLCLINLGDSYSNAGTRQGDRDGAVSSGLNAHRMVGNGYKTRVPGLKNKDLCGQPWRVAFALQARGWYLRSAPPWIKGNPMPESAQDRPGVSHEMWFMLTKRARYFWDAEAVKHQPASYARKGGTATYTANGSATHGVGSHSLHQMASQGRNLRTADFFRQGLTDLIADTEAYLAHLKHTQANGGLLTDPEGTPAALVFNSTAYSGAHFATFSPAMIRPLIQGGTSERGCCPGCGAGWVREVDVSYGKSPVHGDPATSRSVVGRHEKTGQNNFDGMGMPRMAKLTTTFAWFPACPCYDGWLTITRPSPGTPRTWVAYEQALHTEVSTYRSVPCVVFDPFGGAGSVALEADRLGRDAILCEAQPEYVAMARARLTAEAPLLSTVEVPDDTRDSMVQMDLL